VTSRAARFYGLVPSERDQSVAANEVLRQQAADESLPQDAAETPGRQEKPDSRQRIADRIGVPRRRPAGTRLVTVSQLAEPLQVSRNTVYQLMDQGCPYLQVGSDRRFELDEAMRWLRERTARRKAGGLE
jgi:excisionase family DNA binding protein